MQRITQRFVSVYDKFEMIQLISDAYQWFYGEPATVGDTLNKIYRQVKMGSTPIYVKSWCDMYRITLTWAKGNNRAFSK